MSNGILVLVIGDFHIPQRALDVPNEFKRPLGPNIIHHILCTGNLTTKETHDYLKTIAPNVHIVQGVSDEDTTLPKETVLTVGSFKFGLVHTNPFLASDKEDLAVIQRRLDCDVLITGGTHEFKAYKHDGKFFIDPGSATGASLSAVRSPDEPFITPSFGLISVEGDLIQVYHYWLSANSELVVSGCGVLRK